MLFPGCNAISCLNGGTCEDTAAGAICHCAAHNTGLRCEGYGYGEMKWDSNVIFRIDKDKTRHIFC